jgi:hypothetical protein
MKTEILAAVQALVDKANALPGDSAPPLAPTIQGLTVAPNPAPAGASVTINAIVTDATSITLGGLPVALPYTFVPPAGATSWTGALVASGPGGSVNVPVGVTIQPTGDEFRVLLPSAKMHEQAPAAFPDGTAWIGADFVRQSKLAPREVPLIVPMFDAAGGVFAPSRQGVDPTTAHIIPILGNPTQLYSEIQYFDASNRDRSDPFNPEMGDDFAQIVDDLNGRPLPDGPRGVAMTTPYVTVVPHPSHFPAGSPKAGQPIPRHPIAMLVGHDGTLWLVYVTDGVRANVRVTRNGKFPGAQHVTHACVDRSDRSVWYVAEAGMKIGSGWSGSCVVRYDRVDAARGSISQDENANLYTRTVVMPGMQYASQVRTDKDGNLFAIDAGNGNVLRRDKSSGAVTIVGNAQNAYAMSDIPDTGRPYIVGRDMNVRIADFSALASGGAAVIGANIMPSAYVTPPFTLGSDFWTASMDLAGDCGPAGNVRVSRVHTFGNTNTWQFSNGGATCKAAQQIFSPSMQGWNTTGDFRQVHEPYGHYDWLGAIYLVGQAGAINGGYANTPITLTAYNANLPAQYLGDYTMTWAGIRALRRWGLTTVVTAEGWSRFAGCSADELAELAKSSGYAAFAAALTGGLITATPRPGLATWNNGLDLLALGVHLLCNSQRHLIDGKPFVDAWVAYWKTLHPGVAIPAPFTTVTTNVIPDDPNGYLEARQTSANAWRIGTFGIASTPIRYKVNSAGTEKTTPIPADAMIVASYYDEASAQVVSTTKIAALPPGEYAFTVRSSAMPTRAIAVRV